MVGYFLFSLTFLVIAAAEDSIQCPKFLLGYNYNSAENDEVTYWHCPAAQEDSDTAFSVKSVCEEGEIYDVSIGTCKSGTSQRNMTNVEQSEIEALEDNQKLGALYNARDNTFLSGYYLWDNSPGGTVDQNRIVQPKEFSNLDIYQENDLQDRIDKLDVDKELALKVLGGKAQADFGAVNYLKSDKSSTNTARVVMNYRTTKDVVSIPLATTISYPNLCQEAQSENGITHAITGIVRGLRAFLTFDKKGSDDETIEKIGANLYGDVNLIPSYIKKSSFWIDSNNTRVDKISNLTVNYYGDAKIAAPTDFQSALETFKSIEAAAPTSTAPVRYIMTPLSFLCEGQTAPTFTMNQQLVSRAVEILTDLRTKEAEITTLIDSRAAETVPSLKDRLEAYRTRVRNYAATIAKALGAKLKSVKKGQSTERDFVMILLGHDESEFAEDVTSEAVNQLSKEVDAINLIVNEVENYEEVFTIVDWSNKDISCLMNSDRTTKYIFTFSLKVLQPRTSTGDEYSLWYNDLTKVGEIGAQLKDFLAFGMSSHTGNGDQHCFLVELVDVDHTGELVSISYHYSDPHHHSTARSGDGFIPPAAPPKPECTNSYNSAQVTTSPSSNTFVRNIWATAVDSDGGVVTSKNNPITSELITITGLELNTEYQVTTKYKVLDGDRSYYEDLGFSRASESVVCKTWPSSEVRDLSVTAVTSSSMTVTWTTPSLFAEDADIKYVLKVKVSGTGDDEGLIIKLGFDETSKVVTGLQSATIYDIVMQTEADSNKSGETAVTMTTAPGEVEFPQVQEVVTSYPPFIKMRAQPSLMKHQINEAMTSPRLLVEYTELGDEIGSGDTRSMLLGEMSPPYDDFIFNTGTLTLGKDYEITVALQVHYKDTDIVLTSPTSGTLTVSLPIAGTETARVRYNLNKAKKKVSANLQSVSSGVERMEVTMRQLTDDVGSLLNDTRSELREFVHQEELLSETLKKSCIEVGWQFSDDAMEVSDGVNSIYECLDYCRHQEGCNSVSWDKSGQTCSTFTERVGKQRTANANSWTANRICYDTMTGVSNQWKKCIQDGVSLTGVEMEGYNSQGVNNLWDCWEWCIDTPGCQAVSFYEDIRMCQLSSNSRGVPVAATGYTTITMDCMNDVNSEDGLF